MTLQEKHEDALAGLELLKLKYGVTLRTKYDYDQDEYVSFYNLREKCFWSQKFIHQLLGEPDLLYPTPRGSIRLYDRRRVEQALKLDYGDILRMLCAGTLPLIEKIERVG